jgi:hypothetical protein
LLRLKKMSDKLTLDHIDACVTVAKLPAGTRSRQIDTGDALVQKFEFTLPDGSLKTISLGPDGVEVVDIIATNAEFEFSYEDPKISFGLQGAEESLTRTKR